MHRSDLRSCRAAALRSASRCPGQLLSHSSHGQVAHGLDAEGVRHTVEEGKHRRDVDRLGNLFLRPSCRAQGVRIATRNFVGVEGNLAGELQQQPLGLSEAGGIEIALGNGGYGLIVGSLFTQEVSMRVESIRAPVERRDIAGDGFLLAAGEVSLGEVNRVGKGDDLAKKIRAGAETFQDGGDDLTSAEGPPLVVNLGNFSLGLIVLDDSDVVHLGSWWGLPFAPRASAASADCNRKQRAASLVHFDYCPCDCRKDLIH